MGGLSIALFMMFRYLADPILPYLVLIMMLVDLICVIFINAKTRNQLEYGAKYTVISIPAIIFLLLITLSIPTGVSNNYTACQSNLKNLGTALEMHWCDHQEKYPAKLEDLKPEYLREIPRCVDGLKENTTASRFYKKFRGVGAEGYAYEVSENREAYTMYCVGKNHEEQGVAENFPQYNNLTGLVPK